MDTMVNTALSSKDALTIARAEWYVSKLPMIYLGNAVAAVALCIGLWPLHDHGVLLLWGAAVLGHVGLCRSLTWRPSHRPIRQPGTARNWARYLILSSLIQGLIWGAVGPLFLLLDSPAHVVVVMLILVGMAAGAIPMLSSHPSAFAAFAAPAFLPTLGVLAVNGMVLAAGLGIALLLIGIGLSLDTHRTIAGALRLRIEREHLTERLSEQITTAEEAVRDKSRFLAAASHDLRQPLTALNLFISELTSQAGHGHDSGLLARINNSLSGLNDLFDSLLDISRLDTGTVDSAFQAMPLATLFESLHTEFAPQAQAKGLRLRIRPSKAWVHSDPIHLRRIMANLISNAIRHTQTGTVFVDARRRGSRWRVEVRDSGPGIPQAEQTAVFREFYQVERHGQTRPQGLGLGLAIVQRLAALLDIELSLNSASGRGATFALSIASGSPQANTAPLPETEPLTATRVLLIEDEAEVRAAMQAQLSRWGCAVQTAANVEQALTLVSRAARLPDVILSDYRLGGEHTGLDAIRALRQSAQHCIPAAIVSGDSITPARLGTEPQPLRLLRKPVRPAQLRLLVTALATDPSAQQAAFTGDMYTAGAVVGAQQVE